MKTLDRIALWLLPVVLIALVVLGWRLGGNSLSGVEVTGPVTTGPEVDPLCGPDGKPLAPAPVDTALGRHFYPMRPKGEIHPLPVMEVVNQLGVPGAGADVRSGENETAFDDVQTVSLLIDEFARAFGSVPPGELNEEIVRGLQGENVLGIALLPKSHELINAAGELLDRWGTPYRFHPESRWELTVRSAGADQKMWTSDDILSVASPLVGEDLAGVNHGL